MTFRTTLELAGRTATGITVPEDVVESLGSGRQPLVRVTLGDHTYRSRVAVRGGTYKVPVSAEHRERAGLFAGDEVDVALELDTEPREVEAPGDLLAALAGRPEARAFFDGLSPSNRQWFVHSVESAKTAATRERRVAKAVTLLSEGRKR